MTMVFVRLSPTTFAVIKDVLKAKLDKILRANLLNSTALPVMLDSSETWPTMNKEEQ